jgi:hypothetical protein
VRSGISMICAKMLFKRGINQARASPCIRRTIGGQLGSGNGNTVSYFSPLEQIFFHANI